MIRVDPGGGSGRWIRSWVRSWTRSGWIPKTAPKPGGSRGGSSSKTSGIHGWSRAWTHPWTYPFAFKVQSRKGQPFVAWERTAFFHERRREGVLTTIFPVSFATPFFPSPSSSPFPWRGCHLLLPDPVLSIFLVSPLFFALAQKPSWLWFES